MLDSTDINEEYKKKKKKQTVEENSPVILKEDLLVKKPQNKNSIHMKNDETQSPRYIKDDKKNKEYISNSNSGTLLPNIHVVGNVVKMIPEEKHIKKEYNRNDYHSVEK